MENINETKSNDYDPLPSSFAKDGIFRPPPSSKDALKEAKKKRQERKESFTKLNKDSHRGKHNKSSSFYGDAY